MSCGGCTQPNWTILADRTTFACMFRTNFVFDLCDEAPGGMLW